MQRNTLYQLFKYAVYALLTANVFIFYSEESAAAVLQFVGGVPLERFMEAYVATIDTATWVALLLMFELETYTLSDEQLTRPVTISMHLLRILCYTIIVYAVYGYYANLVVTVGAIPLPDISDLCNLVGDNWSYAVDLDEYVLITAENCSTLSPASTFLQFPGFSAAVDQAGLTEIFRLALVDVINGSVWILVVVVLEIDVRLQERNLLVGMAYKISSVSKYVLYSTLFLAAVYWWIKGDFVDFWDAFLWLVAFVFIELNVVQWREESIEQAA